MSTEKILVAVVDGLLDCLGFLELSDDETVNPDDAIRTVETVSARLATLSTDDRHSLAAMIQTRADDESSPARRDFLESTPAALGLLKPSDDHEPSG